MRPVGKPDWKTRSTTATSCAVWSKYSDAQRVNSLHLSKDRLNPPSRSDTYSSSAEGVVRGWNTMVSYISGSVDEELLLRNE